MALLGKNCLNSEYNCAARKIFLMFEILAIVKQKGIPEYEWKLNFPENIPPYIEGQIWNYQPILEYVKEL